MTLSMPAPDVLDRWLAHARTTVGKHVLLICTEKSGACDDVLEELRDIVRSHYMAPDLMANRLAQLGASATARLLRERLPNKKTSRSGDLGEILATEYAERRLSFRIPVRRLRFKSDPNAALQGDDVIGIAQDAQGRFTILKGEAKSRERMTSDVVAAAAEALDQDDGRPDSISVQFTSDRLWEQGDTALALAFDEAASRSFCGCGVEHLLFTLSGSDPTLGLSEHVCTCSDRYRRHVVGVHIRKHAELIERIYMEL